MRSNYFVFTGYLKTGAVKGGSSEPNEPSLDPPLVYVCVIRILRPLTVILNYHMFFGSQKENNVEFAKLAATLVCTYFPCCYVLTRDRNFINRTADSVYMEAEKVA